MSKEEFLQMIKDIGTCESDPERRELLTQLGEVAGKVYDDFTAETEKRAKLETDNETLRDANMKLFLRVGAEKTDKERKDDIAGLKKEEEKEKKNFDDLFDEKGGLK